MYLVEYIKLVHMTCAVLTGLSFLGRGVLMLAGSPLLAGRFLKVAPHVIDTVLLVSAVTLVVMGAWNPLQQPWLLGKILALLLYIACGMVAFRFARRRGMKILFWLLALVVLLHIYVFALTRSLWFYGFLI
jgi:uncharacterized membrane protein SirB2